MILTIDTTDRNKIELGLFDGKVLKCFEFETKKPVRHRPTRFVNRAGSGVAGGQSDDLLMAIDGIFKKEKLSLKDFRAILVNRGPGSFTGIRVGVTTANTLGWILDIPIFDYQEKNLADVLDKASKNNQKKILKPVLPHYS